MASSQDEFDNLFSCVLSSANISFAIKDEQKLAIRNLYFGRDVLGVLPTGFGKTLIFQLLVLLHSERLRKEQLTKKATVLVICPLRSLIEDQLDEAKDLGIAATSLPEASLESIKRGEWKIVYSSPEHALEERFLQCLKEGNFHKNMAAVVIDESHTIETWTGRRKNKGKKGKSNIKVFREAFGELSKLRSFCKEGTPFLALTGTADKKTTTIITNDLAMKKPISICVSPERKNVSFTVKKCKNAHELFTNITWLIELIMKTGTTCPKTIIFCNTLNDIAAVYNHIMLGLGSKAYSSTGSNDESCCLIGIFHSNSFQDRKAKLLKQFKSEGNVRVIISSSALSMGVNFPNVRYIINWGPARNLLDQLQESGRAGRDGKLSHSIILYHGNQLSHCNTDIKNFVRYTGCFRVAAYKPFDLTVHPTEPKHDCCSFCRMSCTCINDEECDASFEFEAQEPSDLQENQLVRPVNQNDKQLLKEALNELAGTIDKPHISVFDQAASHGFSQELIDDVVNDCHNIFSVDDILSCFPVFCSSHVHMIMEVINEIFDDIMEENLQEVSFCESY